MPDPSASAMTPTQMKPGYVLPNHERRQALHRALTTLLQTKYSSALSPAVNLRVALVDLTAAKQHTPTFAGFWAWGSGSAFEGGSLPKILALYAVYQLRFDLNTFAAQKGITKGSVLTSSITTEWKKAGLRSAPNLTALFTFAGAPASPVRATLRTTHDIHHNTAARELIVQLGFEYIGSVALQSGLFDEVQGGLWLNAAYNTPAITWTSSPFPGLQRHNATALATATFFTLLAQLAARQPADIERDRECLGHPGLHDRWPARRHPAARRRPGALAQQMRDPGALLSRGDPRDPAGPGRQTVGVRGGRAQQGASSDRFQRPGTGSGRPDRRGQPMRHLDATRE